MKNRYVLIVVSVVFLLVFTSISSAYKSEIQKNYIVIDNDAEDIDLELIKTKIQEKIDEITDTKIPFIDLIKASYLYNSQDDPDGPYAGGLDDPTDFRALFWGLLGIVFVYFPLSLLLNYTNSLQLIGGILGTITASYNMIMNFGEAFDIIEYTEDGC
ncbi:MAG: hypothetical protein MUO82_11670 [Candidatus Thermoplasmatota archaeon]|nr:hypothetical protein [Candidatus Thermoplasmatota archaeon]